MGIKKHPLPKWWGFPLIILLTAHVSAWADDGVTREYILRHTDAAIMIRVLNVVVPNPKGKRIMGGQGKQLVVTDTEDQQLRVLEVLPILDQPNESKETNHIAMEMMQRGLRYLQHKEKMGLGVQKSGPGAAPAPVPTFDPNGAHTYDMYKSTRSVYAEQDAKMVKQRILLEEEGALPSFTDLTLKGIFKSAAGAPIALLSYGSLNYTARDGGLFERNRLRVKEVTTQVLKDRVIITGPDHRPQEIKFKSSL